MQHRLGARRNARPRLVWAIALLAASSLLSACVSVDVDGDPAATKDAATWDTAMTYLVNARAKLLQKAQANETFNDITKGGVATGVGGAGVGAVFHSAVNPLLGLLTFAAVSDIANQDINPMALSAVYRAGVSNIDCIRASAIVANSDYNALSPQLTDLKAELDTDIQALATDILAANGNAGDQAQITAALPVLASARALSRQMEIFLTDTNIGEHVVAGVDATLKEVTTQAQARSPSINAIYQSGSSFSALMNTGRQLTTQLQTLRASASNKGVTQGGDKLADQIASDQAALQNVVAMVPDMTLGSDLAAISACHAQFQVLAPVTVTPSPVTLAAGATVTLKATGNAPFSIAWDSATPTDVYANGGQQPQLVASATAAAGSYVFHVVDNLGTPSDSVTLTVQPATPTPPQQQPQNQPANQTQNGGGPPKPPKGK